LSPVLRKNRALAFHNQSHYQVIDTPSGSSQRHLNPGCSFEARGNTDEEVPKKAAEHAKTAHKMKQIPPDVLDKTRSAIRGEGKARGKKAGI
jgi:predicted small metal-binding protein